MCLPVKRHPEWPPRVASPKLLPSKLTVTAAVAPAVILVKSAGCSDRSRPPVLIEVGHPQWPCSRVSVVISSFCRLYVKLLTLGIHFTQALTFEVEAVGIVYEAIKDRIGNCQIADNLMPVLDG